MIASSTCFKASAARVARRRGGAFDDVDEKLELAACPDDAVTRPDDAVTRNALDQPGGVFLADIASRRQLVDDEIGAGFGEKLRPARIGSARRLVDLQHLLHLVRRDGGDVAAM